MTINYLRLKGFFDPMMYIGEIIFFVGGVKKAPRADCSKFCVKTTEIITNFHVILKFWDCMTFFKPTKVREC